MKISYKFAFSVVILSVLSIGCNIFKKAKQSQNHQPSKKVVKVKKSNNQSHSVTEEYIIRYQNIAKGEMECCKIPASITMAQAILESGNGRSTLAQKAKNHFGIKCHKSWKGKGYYMDDDAKDECFRVYKKVEDSFKDHSKFLTKGRYKFLYNYNIRDYKSWAHGLKKAGYATNPKYAKLLISLIERYKLHLLDEGKRIVFSGLESIEPEESEYYKPSNLLYDDQLVLVNEPFFKFKKSEGKRSKKVQEEFESEGNVIVKPLSEKEIEKLKMSTPAKIEKVVEEKIKKIIIPKEKKDINKTDNIPSHIIVKKGDTLYAIAKRYGFTTTEIKEINNMKGNDIKIGQKLKLKR